MASRYRQIGRVVAVDPGPGLAGETLAQELSLYPHADDAPDLLVRLGPTPTDGIVTRNPSIHVERETGFTVRGVMSSATYAFTENRLREVTLDVHAAPTALGRSLRRALDAQFTDRSERVGMLYHENVLVPAAAFDPERAPIHASGLQAPDGGVTLFGGTGGVGKTSLELALGRQSSSRFLADDIAVLDASGFVYPNLAYPKIYGYNAPRGSDLRRTVVAPRSPLDRVHWALHSLRGPDRVRRRMSPTALFAGVGSVGGPLRRYVLLVREACPSLTVEPIAPAEAAAMSTAVIAAELYDLLRHLRWHALNRALRGRAPIVEAEALVASWQRLYELAFADVDCLLARIPLDLAHDAFLSQMTAQIDLGG